MTSFSCLSPVYAENISKSNELRSKGFWSEDNKPEFYGTTKIILKKGEEFSLDNTMYRVFVRDFEDFNISDKIKATHNVNTSEVGEYKINYSVTDSHGNTSNLDVPVIVTEDENTNNMIERTMYSLPSVDNIAAMEIHRGNNHDRQMLGIFVKENANLRIRKVSGGSNLTYTMLNNDSHTESTETITDEWKDITFEHDYTPFIKTLYKQNTPVKVEIEWDSTDTGIKELNYYHYGDDEAEFFDKWEKDVDSYSVIEGEALTVLVPYNDRNKITNYWNKGFKNLDNFLDYWKKVVDLYDDMLGLEYDPDNQNDQNVKSKFFVKANAHGAGAAYYAGDHVGVNKDSVATFFEANWGGLHEFGHGYQGSLGKGDLDIGEVSNNIFAHYAQTNKDIYPFNDYWLGKLPDIEERYNEVRLNGGTFKDLNASGKLYFIINFLNSFEGQDTYKEIAMLYRHNVIEGNNMSTQDAWALGVYEAYGINIIDYFEAWGINVSENIKIKIENSNAKNVFSMKDLVNDEALINTIKNDLNVDTNYVLVNNEQLSKYNLSGDLNINITIDNEELIKGKYVILKDGNKEVYRQKIDSSKIIIKDLPIGVYKLVLPEFTASYINNISNVMISNNKTTEKDITYTNIENKNYLDNDVKVQFQGYYYNDAAEIKLLNDNTINTLSTNENLKLHFRYRGTTLFNSGLASDYEYAKIQVLNNNDEEVYLKTVGGKGEMFSNTNVETKEIPVEIGYKLILKYHNAQSKLKFISTLNNDYRTGYEIDDKIEATFIVTEDGLRPYTMSDEDFYNEYIGRLEQYIENFVNNVTEEEIYIKSIYKSEKNIIIRGYKKMNYDDKLKYKDLYDAIINGAKPTLSFANKNIEIKIDEKIDLYSLVKASDFEDGILDKSNIKIETDLDTKKIGLYEVKYIVSDSDNNIVSETITIKVIDKDESGNVIIAGLNNSKGGIMLSTAGLGLRFFTSIENVDPKEAATYYITTASNSKETPKFEIKSTIVNKDYSQIKTSIDFNELSKLEEGVNTKLYLKRVKKGQETTYTELTVGDVDFTNTLNISNSKISISITGDNNIVSLNKSTLSDNLFKQGLSNISWNSTGMVIEGTPTLNGNSNEFENSKVSVLLKDSSGNYIQQSGKNIEIRGVYKNDKYEVTIPYNLLNNVKTFELRLIGLNVQNDNILTKGDLTEFKSTIHNKKEYILSEDSNGVINLTISEVEQLSNELTSVKVTTDPSTGIQQFSLKGSLFGDDVDNIKSSIRYTLIAKKDNDIIFEQLITRVKDSKGSYNGFKANIGLKTLLDANLNQNDEVLFTLRVDYLGNVTELDLNSVQELVSITDLSSNETFEIISKGGKAVLVKK